MSRITTVLALALTLGLLSASLAFGRQGASSGSAAGSATSVTASKAPANPIEKLLGKAGHHKHPKVDLNAATREELEALPGVGEATADKIIAARPLKSVHELLSKGIVTEPEYKKLFSRTMTKPIK